MEISLIVEVTTCPGWITVITFFWVKVIGRFTVTIDVIVVGTGTLLIKVIGAQFPLRLTIDKAVVVEVAYEIEFSILVEVIVAVSEILSTNVFIWPG